MKLKGNHVSGLWRPYAVAAEWVRHLSMMGGGGGFSRTCEARNKTTILVVKRTTN
jgi:hypothetical protein